jgi:hypothetical protein
MMKVSQTPPKKRDVAVGFPNTGEAFERFLCQELKAICDYKKS